MRACESAERKKRENSRYVNAGSIYIYIYTYPHTHTHTHLIGGESRRCVADDTINRDMKER